VAGVVGPAITVEDVLLAHRMIYGVIATAVDPADVEPAVRRAQQLLRTPREAT